jgi:hypothetical protein
MDSVTVSINAPPELFDARMAPEGFAFSLAGTPSATYIVQTSTDLSNWDTLATITLPASGVSPITDSSASTSIRRYYRALKGP